MISLFTPKKLYIQNFCSIGEEQTFTFREGLFFIQGVNEDSTTANSNGSGKSLLIEALCWVLWGQTLRDFKLDDDVINRHVGRDCRVRLEFTLGGTSYELLRKRGVVSKYEKRNDLILFVNGTNATGNSMAETQGIVNDILGLTFDTFSLMMPGARSDLAQMTHAQIIQALEELLQLENLVVARKKLGLEAKSLAAQIADITHLREGLLQEYSKLLVRKEAFQRDVLLAQKREAVKKYALVVEGEQRLKQQQELLFEARGKLRGFNDLLAQTQKVIDGYKTEELQLVQRANNLQKDLDTEKSHISQQISKLKGQQAAAGKQEGTCTLCGSPVNPSHIQSHVQHLQDAIDNLFAKQDKLQTEMSELLSEVQADLVKIKEHVAEQATARGGLRETVSSWETQVSMLDSSVSSDTSSLLARRTEAFTLLKQVDQQLDELDVLVARVDTRCSEIDTEVAGLTERLTVLEAQHNHVTYWHQSLDLEGFRVHVLISVLPFLTQRAQHYASLLSDGELHISFLPKKSSKVMFHVHVVNTLGAAVYNGFSKGERGKVNLAVSLALADLAANISATKLSFRFFDEAFDGIDKTGMTLLVQLLNEQAKDHSSIYVISHNPDIESMISNVVTVRKKKDTTYIEDSV